MKDVAETLAELKASLLRARVAELEAELAKALWFIPPGSEVRYELERVLER